jgi:mannuronan synthase
VPALAVRFGAPRYRLGSAARVCSKAGSVAAQKVLSQSMFLSLYVLALAALLLHAPMDLLDPANRPFIVVIGFIGTWRYGWAIVHFARAQYYMRSQFLRLRRDAMRLMATVESENATPPAVYLVCTSYRIRAETTTHVFRSLVEEAARYPGPVTIVASLVEMADQRLVKQQFSRLAPPERVRLNLVRIQGHGKRDALAVALIAVARDRPPPDAVVAVLDGDTLLAPNTLVRCLPFFRLMPEVGGLTTDEDAVVDGSWLMRDWHRLRFAQRQILMCSMALSGRLLAMTGRMSMYRVDVATDPDFIERIRDDHLEHWRLGRIKLVTGEDKSTWQWLLEHRWRMLYVPDVRMITIEHPPDRRFVVATTILMRRWLGNMLRSSSRAIALGPREIGLFTWWSLIDQRLSMWTTLLMPLSAIAFALLLGPLVLYAYLIWVMSTRLIQALLLLTVRDTISGSYPLLILYGQIYGAIVKTWILFHPYQQGWTRQPVPVPGLEARFRWWQSPLSNYTYAVAILALLTVVAFATGLLPLPSAATVTAAVARLH